MNHIGGFFNKLARAFADSNARKQIVISACKNAAKVDVLPEQIEIQGKTVRLSVSPGARSVIFLNKHAVLEEINRSLKPPISEIR